MIDKFISTIKMILKEYRDSRLFVGGFREVGYRASVTIFCLLKLYNLSNHLYLLSPVW